MGFKKISIAATALILSTSLNAASINVTQTEVSVGLLYSMGYGPIVAEDEVSGISEGLRPAVVQLGGHLEGYYPFPTKPQPSNFHQITLDSVASASLAYDTEFGAPSIYGTSSVSWEFKEIISAGGIAAAPSTQNYIWYEFVVNDGPAEYSLNFENDALGILKLRTLSGDTVLNLAAGQAHQSTLDPGTYTLHTWLSLSGTAMEGPRSASNSFTMTFQDSTLTINPVPVPAAMWLFGSGLIGLAGLARQKKA